MLYLFLTYIHFLIIVFFVVHRKISRDRSTPGHSIVWSCCSLPTIIIKVNSAVIRKLTTEGSILSFTSIIELYVCMYVCKSYANLSKKEVYGARVMLSDMCNVRATYG
jgi:hypothetical protein